MTSAVFQLLLAVRDVVLNNFLKTTARTGTLARPALRLNSGSLFPVVKR